MNASSLEVENITNFARIYRTDTESDEAVKTTVVVREYGEAAATRLFLL